MAAKTYLCYQCQYPVPEQEILSECSDLVFCSTACHYEYAGCDASDEYRMIDID
jgi:hypothetical protein